MLSTAGVAPFLFLQIKTLAEASLNTAASCQINSRQSSMQWGKAYPNVKLLLTGMKINQSEDHKCPAP